MNRYKHVLEAEYFDYEKNYIFLTPEAEYSSNIDAWISMSYIDIITCLESIVSMKKDIINPKVISFINQYI